MQRGPVRKDAENVNYNKVIPLTESCGDGNSFSSQIFREKRQTGRKEEERLKRLSMGDKSGIRQVKGRR